MLGSGHTGLWLTRKTADTHLLPGNSARPFSCNVPQEQRVCWQGYAGTLLLEGQFTSEDSILVFYSLDCTLEYSRNSVLLSFVFPVWILVSATQYVLYKHVLNVWKPSNVRGGICVATWEEFMRFSKTSHRAEEELKYKTLSFQKLSTCRGFQSSLRESQGLEEKRQRTVNCLVIPSEDREARLLSAPTPLLASRSYV